jgi:hypothetical protein
VGPPALRSQQLAPTPEAPVPALEPKPQSQLPLEPGR